MSARVHWQAYGPHALLLRFPEHSAAAALAQVRRLAGYLEHHPPGGLVEVVPALRTLLLVFEPQVGMHHAETVQHILSGLQQFREPGARPKPMSHEIPVVYGGQDIERVASTHGLSVRDVVRKHSARAYHVGMVGFSPGFAYLEDLTPELHTPRLPTPRPVVAAGSVAIGGAHTAIYPMATPGGWNIIGRTTVPLFRPEEALRSADPRRIFCLHHGDEVRFQPVAPGILP